MTPNILHALARGLHDSATMRLGRMLRLVLPLLVPSWRFFDTIGPAPRVEIAWLATPSCLPAWRALHPRPARIGAAVTLRRLFWNPEGNAALYLTSRAERLLETPAPAAIDDFLGRVRDAALIDGTRPAGAAWLQVRIVSTTREDAGILDDVAFLSTPLAVDVTHAGRPTA